MRNGTIKKLSIVIALTVVCMVLFSVPLGSIPALGGLLFPGGGIWRVPGEVPAEERLVIPTLSDTVYVIRDEWGVPHIYASNESDCMFAQGYIHAQDRMFQMDMLRRQVRGKLSEVVGSIALPRDKLYLAMGCEYWANETYKYMKQRQESGDPVYSAFLPAFERYVDGINYYIQTHKYEKPIEYHLAGFEPSEWSVVDTLCYAKEMAKQMTWNYNDLLRLVNSEAFKTVPSWYNDLFSTYQPYQIPICPDYGEFSDISIASLPTDASNPVTVSSDLELNPSLLNAVSVFLDGLNAIDTEKNWLESREIIGSNNWVVGPGKSATGKPILCNDMHLGWNVPGVWYEQHLYSSDSGLNAYGFAIPGMPLMGVGYTNHIAWGYTNTGYDVLDWVYYTKVDDNHYNLNGVDTAFTYRNYSINVKGQAPVEFIVKETVDGPVLNDFIGVDVSDELGDVWIASKWTGQAITEEARALYGMAHAKNRAEFNEASQYWHTLAQNMVYADIEGNIGIRPTGRVPIRSSGNGAMPYDGSKGQGGWTGYVAFNDLPHSENPDQHYLVSANQIVAGPSYSLKYLQNEYAAGYRARRINEVLSQAEVIGVMGMIDLQYDINSSAAHAFTPYFISAIENSADPTKYTNVLTEIKNWSYKMDKDLAAPTIYRKWRDKFMDNTFDDEFTEYGAIQSVGLNKLEWLMKVEPNSHWFDNIDTTTITERRDDIIIEALDDAIEFLGDFYGSSDPSTWRWGDLHKLQFDSLTGLDSLSKGPYEAGGEGYTVTPSRVNIEEGVGYARGGSSERIIVDFSNLNNSRSCIPSGQRAISSSKHYADQLEKLFLTGKYHKHWFANIDPDTFPQEDIESRIYFVTSLGGS